MKDFNRVAIMSENDSVSKGFMFEYIQENFPGFAWQPVGYAVMNAFEETFGGMNAPAKAVRENRESFVNAVKKELGSNASHPACVALTEKIRTTLQPASVAPKPAVAVSSALTPVAAP